MTYPEVSEIRTEWTPEQIAPSEAEALRCRTESERKAHEVQQQRIEQIRSGGVRPIPTVCPKR